MISAGKENAVDAIVEILEPRMKKSISHPSYRGTAKHQERLGNSVFSRCQEWLNENGGDDVRNGDVISVTADVIEVLNEKFDLDMSAI